MPSYPTSSVACAGLHPPTTVVVILVMRPVFRALRSSVPPRDCVYMALLLSQEVPLAAWRDSVDRRPDREETSNRGTAANGLGSSSSKY